MVENKFKISLRENGEHSFKRGLESYQDYLKIQDRMFLKDAIMFLHHGIELLMKAVLVRHNFYLMLEDLKDIHTKQIEADKLGIGILALEKPPKTVSYEIAIERAAAFIKPSELDKTLKDNLKKLNSLRNQIEHYEVDRDVKEVVQLLDAIHEPIFKLFERQLGTLHQLHTSQINQTWDSIRDIAKEQKLKNQEILALIQKFDGQRVPGYLFGVEGEVTLPKFSRFIEESHRLGDEDDGIVIEVDILAESDSLFAEEYGVRWAIEIIVGSPSVNVVPHVASYRSLLGATPWIVAFDKIPHATRLSAKELSIMITGAKELQELRELIEI